MFEEFHKLQPSSRLLLIGDGPLKGELQEKARLAGLEKAVVFTGIVPHEEIRRYLASVDVALAPYPRLDNFYYSPLKLFEYMAAGRVVVASNAGQIPQIIRHRVTGLLYEPGDRAGLLNCLCELRKDAALREERRRGRIHGSTLEQQQRARDDDDGADHAAHLLLGEPDVDAMAHLQADEDEGRQRDPAREDREVEKQARMPLKDASVVNATRFALVERLGQLGLPIGTWSGGRTRWNRARWGIEKRHANDALCVGDMVGVEQGRGLTLTIQATGRGSHCRTNVDNSGFPRGYLMRRKRVRGFSTGDLVRAGVPQPLKTAGVHTGRVAVRASGSFRVGKVDGINVRYCVQMQRADGYAYGQRGLPDPCPK